MLNKAIMIGRLTKDPELRTTTTNRQVCSFILAVDRRIKPGTVVDQDADFISCVAWNKTAEIITTYCKKGSQLMCEGKIQTRNYENQQGQKVYVTEVLVDNIEMLGSKKSNQDQTSTTATTSYEKSGSIGYNEFYNDDTPLDIASDDLPF